MSARESSEQNDKLFRVLDARFRAPLMAFFLRRVRNRSDAEDLTQETFARLSASPTFDPSGEPNAYVFRVASNLLHDRARTASRLKHLPIAVVDSDLVERLATEIMEDNGPERVLIGRQGLVEAFKCLDELGERTKSIFILYRLEGMKQKDIATLYGMGLSTVEKHLTKAVAHLTCRFGAKWSW